MSLGWVIFFVAAAVVFSVIVSVIVVFVARGVWSFFVHLSGMVGAIGEGPGLLPLFRERKKDDD